MIATCGHDLVWHNAYKGAFDLISPDSFSHPAKMSPSLCYRILDHLKELGLLHDSDTILDPMGGTGMTAICANAKGYHAVTIELEQKFVGFQKENKDYAGRKLCQDLDWQIIQGDARKLSELLTESGLVTVSSPPYLTTDVDGARKMPAGYFDKVGGIGHTNTIPYGTTEGQIGNLKDIPLKVITSPSNSYALRGIIEEKGAKDAIHQEDFSHEGNVRGTIPRTRNVPIRNSGNVQSKSISSVQGICQNGDKGSVSRQARPDQTEGIQGGQSVSSLSGTDREGKMRDLPQDGESVDTSQGFRPLQQQLEQLAGTLSELPSSSAQNIKPQGDEKQCPDRMGQIVSVTSPPYGIDMKTAGGIDWAKANRPDRRIEVNPETGKAYTRHNVYGVNTGGYGDATDNIGNLKDVPLEQNERMFINSGQAFFELPSDGVEGVMPVCVPTLRSGMSQDIIGKQFSVLSLDFEIWQQLWQQLQEVIISGHTTTVNILATLSFITPGRIPELRKYFMKPEYPLAITHTNFEVGTEPPLTTLARNIKGSLAVNDTSQISQISRITHNTIICQLPYIFKPLKTVTSPPYENSLNDGHTKKRTDGSTFGYHEGANDNIGNANPQSYLSAMKVVYAEIAKCSDVLAIVVKNPTRNGQLRRLDLDTVRLLEQTGWKIHCRHQALLFEELEQEDMFAGKKKKVKGRLSFFKRLSWQKGQPVANFEDIIIAVRNGGGNLTTITSPPYFDTSMNTTGFRPPHDTVNFTAQNYGDTPGQIGKLKDK